MPFALLLAATVTAAAAAEPVMLARIERPVLAVAHVGTDRALLLEDDRLTLWRLGPASMTLEATLLTEPASERVRHAGGLIHAPEGEGGAWIHRSGWAEAILVSVENGALVQESAASALPWPGAPSGVGFRAGTSLIEGRLDDLPDGPYVALSPDGRAAVSADGRLLLARREAAPAASSDLRAGSAVVQPWPDVLVASSPTPDAPDALLVVRTGSPARLLARVPMNGRIRALAVRAEGPNGVVLAAIEDESGHALMRVDLRQPTGDQP